MCEWCFIIISPVVGLIARQKVSIGPDTLQWIIKNKSRTARFSYSIHWVALLRRDGYKAIEGKITCYVGNRIYNHLDLFLFCGLNKT